MLMMITAVSCGAPKGIHLSAYVDEGKILRLRAEGRENNVGIFTNNGFVPHHNIWNTWQPESWFDTTRFSYDPSDGKVTVMKSGYYLIYVQAVFHDSAARKSLGIYITDAIVPVAECISFDLYDGPAQTRYSPCNTMVYARINKNDTVFIKTLESARTVILQKPLMFWGIVRQ